MDWLWPLLAAPFVGSFVCVLIRRLPQGRPVILSRSACEACGAALGVRDLVPFVSYAALRGRCRQCGGRISAQHLQVELAAVAVVASATLASAEPARLWLDCLFGWTLLALAWIDWEHMLLPDALTLPLIPAGLFATLLRDPDAATEHALAAVIAYGALRGLAAAYRAMRGRDGLGGGDAKLLAAIAAWTGLEALPFVLIGAAAAGLAVAALMALRGAKVERATAIPFGPCLALAGWLVRLQT